MKITVLGTGTSQGIPVIGCSCPVCSSSDPRDNRTRTSVLIETQGTNIVIDTGPDFRQQLLSNSISDVDAVLLTHEHRDHTAGLDDVRPINFKYQRDMPVYATAHVQKNIKEQYAYIFNGTSYPGLPKIKLCTIFKNQQFEVGALSVTPIEVWHHKLPVMGFRIGDFSYVTDAKTISNAEKEKIKGSKVLILNALRKKDHLSHLTLEEAIDLIDELKPEKTYLTHLSHQMGTHEDVEKSLPTHIRIAYDGQVIEL